MTESAEGVPGEKQYCFVPEHLLVLLYISHVTVLQQVGQVVLQVACNAELPPSVSRSELVGKIEEDRLCVQLERYFHKIIFPLLK